MRVLRAIAPVFRSFRNRNFRIFTLTNCPSLITDWMTRVAVAYVAWDLTHSATWLGIIGFAELFPSLIFGVFAGAIADRFDRRWLMIFSQFLLVTQAVALSFFTYADLMTVEQLAALTFYFGAIKALDQPTRHSLIPGLVRKEDVSTAIGFDSISFNTARIIGPAIAGVVIITYGVGPIFIANSITFTFFMFGLFFVRYTSRPGPKSSQGFAGSIGEGFRYCSRHPGIGPLLLVLCLISVVARPLLNFIPGFAGDVFEAGAEGQAILTTAMGVGAMAAGVYLTQRPSVKGLTAIFTTMTAGLGIALVVFNSNQTFWAGVLAMVVIGFTVLINGLGSRMLIQTASAPHMRGRVASFYTTILRGAGSLGAILLGVTADVIGLQVTFFLAGLVCLVAWLWTNKLRPTMGPALENPPAEEAEETG
jgi:MFS family permease